MISHSELKAVLAYMPSSGHFFWKKRLNARCRLDEPAGTVTDKGYIRIRINGESYYAHVLAWFYMTGEWPVGLVDHKDLDKANNRWLNLRPATHSENQWNRAVPRNSTTGHKNIHIETKTGKFRVTVRAHNKFMAIGRYLTLDEAIVARDTAVNDLHGAFSRTAP